MVLLDDSGKPKVFQHSASLFKKGKMMDYETLHAFVTECLVNEYRAKKYDVVNFILMEDDACDFKIKMPSGRAICCKVVLTEESFKDVIAKTDFTNLFDYCRKEKAYPRLFTVSAWCFATPEGSKMINGSSFAFKVDSISLLDKDDEPNEHFISEESLIKGFADAWNNRDASPLNDILSSHVHYSSFFVFDEIRGKIETMAYLGDIFRRIKASNGKSKLTLCRSLGTGDLMLADLTKSGIFSFQFNDSRISDIRLKPLDRSQVEYIGFSENCNQGNQEKQPGQEEEIVGAAENKVDEPVSAPEETPATVVETPAALAEDSTPEGSNVPADKAPVVENKPVENKPVEATQTPLAVKTPEPVVSPVKPVVTPEKLEPKIEHPAMPQAEKHEGAQNKWWIIGLSYLLGLILCACASFIYIRIAVDDSKYDIQSQVDILPSNRKILYFSNDQGSLRYTKSDAVPSGDFYKAVKSFYKTGKMESWYYRLVEQTTPTSFIYTTYSPYAVGLHTTSGSGIDQKFNELKSHLRSYLKENASLSDNNGYYMNSMLNADSKYHTISRVKDESNSSEWKYGDETSSYELYYWRDTWKCSVVEKSGAATRDFFIYTGILFLIISIIMAIVFMAIPSFRAKTKE